MRRRARTARVARRARGKGAELQGTLSETVSDIAGRAAVAAARAQKAAAPALKGAAATATPAVRSAGAVLGRAAQRGAGAAAEAQEAAAPAVRSAAETLSEAAERAAEALSETAERLAQAGAEQAGPAIEVGRHRLAGVLESSAQRVRPKKRHRVRKLVIIAGAGTAVFVVVTKTGVADRIRSLLGHGEPEPYSPSAEPSITLPPPVPPGEEGFSPVRGVAAGEADEEATVASSPPQAHPAP